MLKAITNNLVWCQHLGLKIPCDQEKIAELQEYFLDSAYPAPEWVTVLRESSIETNRMAADRIVLIRQEILKWLPSCWKFGADEHFSRSKDHPEYLAAKPNICANTPNENAEIAHCWELVNKTLQLYVTRGADSAQAKTIIQSLQRLAVIQRGKIKVEPGSDPHSVIEQTEAARLFNKLVMSLELAEGEEYQLMRIDTHDEKRMEEIQKILNSGQPEAIHLIIQYLTEEVLPQLEFHSDQIYNSPMHLGAAVLSEQGYSGTTNNLYIFSDQFTQRPKETVVLDKGANGKIIDTLCRSNRTVHLAGPQLKTPEQLMDALHRSKELEKRNAFKAFIDIGAYFKGQSNLQIAQSFSQYFSSLKEETPIEGILYYDDATNQLACLKKGHDKPILIGATDAKTIYSATSLRPEQLFTFYDQFHTIGANIIQDPKAKAFYTLGSQTDLGGDLQGSMRMRGLLEEQEIEAIVPQDLLPLISHLIEEPIDGLPTIEQILLFSEINGLFKDRENNLKVFSIKLNTAVRKHVLPQLYTSDGEEEDVLYAATREFFIRLMKEELFEQYGGAVKNIDREKYIQDQLDRCLAMLQRAQAFLPKEVADSLHRELQGVVEVSKKYLSSEIESHELNENATVEKVADVDKKVDKLTQQELESQREMGASSKPNKAEERKWDFSSPEALMQQLCSFQRGAAVEKPLVKRLPDVMLDKLDLALFSDCFSERMLLSTNFLETATRETNLLDKLQKTPLEALLFFDYEKRPRLLLLSSQEAEEFFKFMEGKDLPFTLLNPKAEAIPGGGIDPSNREIEQLCIQMLFFSGRFSSLDLPQWQAGLEGYLSVRRDLKRDLFEGVLLHADQSQVYQNSSLALKLNAPSDRENEADTSLSQLKRAKFLFNQKRFAQGRALIDQQMTKLKETDLAEIALLIDLAKVAASETSDDWAVALFQQLFLLIEPSVREGKWELVERLIETLNNPIGYRLKQEIASFVLRQPGISDRLVEATFQNSIRFLIDEKTERGEIANKIEEILLFLEQFPDHEKIPSYASQLLTPFTIGYRKEKVCRNIFEAMTGLMRDLQYSGKKGALLQSIARPYLEAYFKLLVKGRTSALNTANMERQGISSSLMRGYDKDAVEIYADLGKKHYGISSELDQMIEEVLVDPVVEYPSGFSGSGWEVSCQALKEMGIPYADEKAENMKLRFSV